MPDHAAGKSSWSSNASDAIDWAIVDPTPIINPINTANAINGANDFALIQNANINIVIIAETNVDELFPPIESALLLVP